MSRVGKKPIAISPGVVASVENSSIHIKGPKGSLSMPLDPRIAVEVVGAEINCKVKDASVDGSLAVFGLVRSLISNMVKGCSVGFSKDLEIIGTGYRANVKGTDLELALGFSHSVVYPIPAGISITVDKLTKVTVAGVDKRLVGQTAAEIRFYRKPEPYKGKGVKYVTETIVRKAGKAAGAGK